MTTRPTRRRPGAPPPDAVRDREPLRGEVDPLRDHVEMRGDAGRGDAGGVLSVDRGAAQELGGAGLGGAGLRGAGLGGSGVGGAGLGAAEQSADPEILHRRIHAERVQLARTVEELVARMDVKSRVRHRAGEIRARAATRWRTLSTQARRSGARAARRATTTARETAISLRRVTSHLLSDRCGSQRRPR
jgi:hypothetical protein